MISLTKLLFAWMAGAASLALAQAPDWQAQAGGKMEFEVASVKQDKDAFRPPNFPLDAGDAYRPVGGRFFADFPLAVYITFAYKQFLTADQIKTMIEPLPKWVATDRFAIEARAKGNPTKNQMRLMVQALLADRFQLVVHAEMKEGAILALVRVKPDKIGPQLRPHSEGVPCDAPRDTAGKRSAQEVFPEECEVQALSMTPDGLYRAGSRNTTLNEIANTFTILGRLGRPVVDRTGLSGRFDYTLEWVRDPETPAGPGPEVPLNPQGPTFLEALREQLGLRLESARGPIQTLVVDHVERPTEN